MRGHRTFLIACLVAAAASVGDRTQSRPAHGESFPGWPTTFEGRTLTRVELEDREQRFFETFPGMVARFTDGEREIVLRWIHEGTHQLHPATVCFRGRGFEIEPRDGVVDRLGRRWGTFRATRDETVFEVSELVYDTHESWSDVSAWYWSATLQHSSGPWWAIMVARNLQGKVRPRDGD